MNKTEIEKFAKLATHLHSKLECFSAVAGVLGVSTSDVIHLLLDTEAGQMGYFKDKVFKQSPF